MTLELKKLKLIDWIVQLKDEAVIDALEQLQKSRDKSIATKKEHQPKYSTYSDIKNRKVDVEQLKIEQNYSPTSPAELTAIAVAADIEESMDKLLNDLDEIR